MQPPGQGWPRTLPLVSGAFFVRLWLSARARVCVGDPARKIDRIACLVYKAALIERKPSPSPKNRLEKGKMHRTSAPFVSRIHRLVLGFGLMLAAGTVMAAATAGEDGSVAAGKAKSAICAACHGADGNGVGNPDWPKLAGQPREYLAKQLHDFKSGARKDLITNGTMNGIAAGLSAKDIEDLADYFGNQKLNPGVARDPELVKLGERIYRGGIAPRRVPACMSCHGPSGHGIPPKFPRLSGQNAGYTQKQMLFFKAGTRRNDNGIMTPIAFELSEKEIEAIADYTAGLR